MNPADISHSLALSQWFSFVTPLSPARPVQTQTLLTLSCCHVGHQLPVCVVELLLLILLLQQEPPESPTYCIFPQETCNFSFWCSYQLCKCTLAQIPSSTHLSFSNNFPHMITCPFFLLVVSCLWLSWPGGWIRHWLSKDFQQQWSK